jgi:methionyl-tRNA synthetase
MSIGTDEHGLKVQQAAQLNQMKPLEFCNLISKEFMNLFNNANIDYSDFIRTTEQRHEKTVCEIWNKLVERGYIYKGFHEGWYSVSDEQFVPESQTTTENINGRVIYKSKETGKELEWTKEVNYKFRLGLFKIKLLDWLNTSKVISSSNYHKQVCKHIESQDLHDLSVSRISSHVKWGIDVPNDKEHKIYVWLDALANYLTVSDYPCMDLEYKWSNAMHIIGKDILKYYLNN